jgi:hypothetical protein
MSRPYATGGERRATAGGPHTCLSGGVATNLKELPVACSGVGKRIDDAPAERPLQVAVEIELRARDRLVV